MDSEHNSSARERLIAATLLELEQYGPTNLKIKRVATTAGVTPALIYRYFADRDQLIGEAWATKVPELWRALQAPVLQIIEQAESPQSLVELCVGALTNPGSVRPHERAAEELLMIRGHGRRSAVMGQRIAEMAPELYELIVRPTERLESLGWLRPGITPEVFVRVLTSLLFSEGTFTSRQALGVTDGAWEEGMRTVLSSLLVLDAENLRD